MNGKINSNDSSERVFLSLLGLSRKDALSSLRNLAFKAGFFVVSPRQLSLFKQLDTGPRPIVDPVFLSADRAKRSVRKLVSAGAAYIIVDAGGAPELLSAVRAAVQDQNCPLIARVNKLEQLHGLDWANGVITADLEILRAVKSRLIRRIFEFGQGCEPNSTDVRAAVAAGANAIVVRDRARRVRVANPKKRGKTMTVSEHWPVMLFNSSGVLLRDALAAHAAAASAGV